MIVRQGGVIVFAVRSTTTRILHVAQDYRLRLASLCSVSLRHAVKETASFVSISLITDHTSILSVLLSRALLYRSDLGSALTRRRATPVAFSPW